VVQGTTGVAEHRLVDLAEIEEAARVLAPVAVRTPLLPVPGLKPGLLVKPESLQPTGSFKLRGAYNAIRAGTTATRWPTPRPCSGSARS
jgi:threonine dehydratase